MYFLILKSIHVSFLLHLKNKEGEFIDNFIISHIGMNLDNNPYWQPPALAPVQSKVNYYSSLIMNKNDDSSEKVNK